MRIAITGASGNVGTAVTRRLLAEGGYDVVGIARRPPEPAGADGVEWHPLDLTEDACLPHLERAFAGADAVIHLAWGFQPSHDEAYLRELGVGGTRRVVTAATRAGVPHLVHQSSMGAYSPRSDDRPVDETWPTQGVSSSRYSRHKAAAERLLDEHESRGAGPLVTRTRPGIIGQRSAGSALLRYGLPALAPARLLDLLPVLPMDRGLTVPMVHADDVADAMVRILEQRPGGSFNLAADPPVTAATIADVLGARLVHVPSGVVRAAMSVAWHARLQPVDAGWLDMAFALPLLDSGRARRELGWTPTRDAVSVFEEVVAGMRDAASGATPILRPRTVARAVGDAVRGGPVGQRHRP
jgi:nucleoside-diphosphate-sugar epimerase